MLKTSRRLRISRNPDPFFAVEYHGSNCNIIAPGLVHIYNVRFSPADRRDYEYRVELVADDDDVFVVPVIGEEVNYIRDYARSLIRSA